MFDGNKSVALESMVKNTCEKQYTAILSYFVYCLGKEQMITGFTHCNIWSY